MKRRKQRSCVQKKGSQYAEVACSPLRPRLVTKRSRRRRNGSSDAPLGKDILNFFDNVRKTPEKTRSKTGLDDPSENLRNELPFIYAEFGENEHNIEDFVESVDATFYKTISRKQLLRALKMESTIPEKSPSFDLIPCFDSFEREDFELLKFRVSEFPGLTQEIFDYFKRTLSLPPCLKMFGPVRDYFNAVFGKVSGNKLYELASLGKLHAIFIVDEGANGKVVAHTLWTVLKCDIHAKSENNPLHILHVPGIWMGDVAENCWYWTLSISLCIFGSLPTVPRVNCCFLNIEPQHLKAMQTITNCFSIKSRNKYLQAISILNPYDLAVAFEEVLRKQIVGLRIKCKMPKKNVLSNPLSAGVQRELDNMDVCNYRFRADPKSWCISNSFSNGLFQSHRNEQNNGRNQTIEQLISSLRRRQKILKGFNMQIKHKILESFMQESRQEKQEKMEEINNLVKSKSVVSQANEVNEVDDDLLCMLCGYDSVHGDLIVICDICDQGYHQSCGGIPRIPDGEWFCEKCHKRNAQAK